MTELPDQTAEDITHDAVVKINAGAALLYALYYAPADWSIPFLKEAPDSVVDALMKAQKAYKVGRL